jgi:hypothetical protein
MALNTNVQCIQAVRKWGILRQHHGCDAKLGARMRRSDSTTCRAK